MSRNVSEFVVERMQAWGVRRSFGCPGDGIAVAVDDADKAGTLKFVQVRHEEMARSWRRPTPSSPARSVPHDPERGSILRNVAREVRASVLPSRRRQAAPAVPGRRGPA